MPFTQQLRSGKGIQQAAQQRTVHVEPGTRAEVPPAGAGWATIGSFEEPETKRAVSRHAFTHMTRYTCCLHNYPCQQVI